jgi:excisionase family DNA binding protein
MLQADQKLLTVGEVALMLRVSTPTVRRLMREAGLPFVKLGPAHSSSVRIDRAELDAWLHGEGRTT